MLERFVETPMDPVMALARVSREDRRPGKIDLGVGVYKDSSGGTPVMRAVKQAEGLLVKNQKTKAYVGMTGTPEFQEAMIDLIFGEGRDKTGRLRTIQTPGGTGALRLAAELIRMQGTTIYVPNPTWPNHKPIAEAAGLEIITYPYLDGSGRGVDQNAMLSALSGVGAGATVLVHGCCHNPTGVDILPDLWEKLGSLALDHGFMLLVDFAYQGFGSGLRRDAMGVKILAGIVPEMLVAASCSKNFGIYRDRTGALVLMGRDADATSRAFGAAGQLCRVNWSMPPDHGAAVVATILGDPDLRRVWEDELNLMRDRMINLREGLADALRARSNSDRFDFLRQGQGMFSRLGLARGEVDRLREKHAIYIVGDSRFNVAGLPEERLDHIASSIVDVLD